MKKRYKPKKSKKVALFLAIIIMPFILLGSGRILFAFGGGEITIATVFSSLFLGILAPLPWLYTYKYDAWKFWVNLLLILFSLGMWSLIAWAWVLIDMDLKPKEFFEEYYDYR